jgi:hypothetical protein
VLLSARFVQDCTSANNFEFCDVAELSEGDSADIYFQLIDVNLDKALDGYSPAGRRYVPLTGAVLSCTLENIDDAIKITRYATNPFPLDDRSIWKISILASDKIKGTSNLRLILTEGASIKHGVVKSGVRIHPSSC